MSIGISPAIKWSGSKRSVAPTIAKFLPKSSRYLEPFVGGGAMLPYRPAFNAIAGDIIPELIHLWKLIQKDPEKVSDGYSDRWSKLQSKGYTVFYEIRDAFNRTRDPVDLLFLSRTCVNGLIRFNAAGSFNNSLHYTRKGINPIHFRKILHLWSNAVRGVAFLVADYRETLSMARKGDIAFLDPPYVGTRGRYLRDAFDFEDFYSELDRLNKRGVRWVLTFDGEAGSRKYPADVPQDIYKRFLKIKTGQSPFSRVMQSKVEQVTESMYFNFEPTSKTLSQLHQFGTNLFRTRLSEDVEQRFSLIA